MPFNNLAAVVSGQFVEDTGTVILITVNLTNSLHVMTAVQTLRSHTRESNTGLKKKCH